MTNSSSTSNSHELSETYLERFSGIGRCYGQDAMEIFQHAHIAVIGIGGVGSWAVEALARSGVGGLTLIDHDTISASNINRQIHSASSSIGISKLEAMGQRALDINPELKLKLIDEFISEDNCAQHLGSDLNYVIDAIDSIKHKCALIYYCKRNKIPIITTGGAGGLVSATQIDICDLSKTYNDPLAAKVRSQLRHQYNFTRNPKSRFGVECVFSVEQQKYPQADGSVGQQKPGVAGLSLDCNFGYGSSSVVTSVFGFTAAARALEKHLERQRRLRTNQENEA